MMKRLTNLLIFTATLSFLASCVAEKKGKSPTCGEGEEFNKVSQKCINVRRAPTSTLETIELLEDSAPKTFTLKYTDVNNDQAVDCQVFDTVTEIEVRSPLVPSIKADTLAVLNHAISCRTSINTISYPAQSLAATTQLSIVQAAYDVLLTTEDTITISSALNIFTTEVSTLSNLCESITGQPIVQYYGSIANNFNDELLVKKRWLDKRCYCSAGTCTTEVFPLENENGDFGITYNITEGVDGTSVNKEVLVSVIPVNDLPVPVDFHFFGNEMTTLLSPPVSFSVPPGRDVESDMSFVLTYEIVSPPTKGTIVSCALENFPTSGNDTSCYYIPNDHNDGVASSANKLASFTTVGTNLTDGIVFSALVGDTAGESISVEFLPHPLGSSGENVLIENTGRSVSIYIEDATTTINAIINAVNADKDVSSFLFASPEVPANLLTNFQEITVAPTNLAASGVVFDTFTYRVRDEFGASLGIAYGSVDIVLQDDPPVALAIVPAELNFTEDTSASIMLSISDAETDAAATCTVNPTNSTFAVASTDLVVLVAPAAPTCVCAAAGCSVSLRPAPNFYGDAYFTWTVSANGQTTSVQQATVSVASVNDKPYARYLDVDFNESPTATPVQNSVLVDFSAGAIDIDGNPQTFNYEYVPLSGIGNGTLSGCVDGADNIDLAIPCYFTPGDGNVNGVSSTLPIDVEIIAGGAGNSTVTATSKTNGDESNSIEIRVRNHTDVENGYPVYVEVDSATKIITVFVDYNTTTFDEIDDAINDHAIADAMVDFLVTNPTNTVIGPFDIDLIGAEVNPYQFDYIVTDAGGLTATGTYHININPVDDAPILCPYSTFPSVADCGLNGCIDNQSPIIANITPSAADHYFYDLNAAVCYKSAASGSGFSWNVLSSFSNVIDNQVVHQNGSFKIDNIRIDEGGADVAEDTNTIRITDIVINDGGLGLIPKKAQNVKVFYDNSEISLTQTSVGVSPLFSGDIDGAGVVSSDALDFSIEITPSNSKVGSATVVITFQEFDGGVAGQTIDLTIPVEVTNISIQHKGWQQVIASGPKVDTFGQVIDQDYVCNYSESKCSGGACIGNTAELSTTTADQPAAIYLDTTVNKCYYAITSGVGTTTWQQFDSFCGITPQEIETSCSNSSCISTSNASALQAAKLNSLYTQGIVDVDGIRVATTCFRSFGIENAGEWEEYRGFGSVLLKWNPMSIIGSGSIMGFNVYRRLSGEDFDFSDPINKNIITSFSNSYVDDSTNSKVGPIPNTVYFYEVVPMVQESGASVQFQVRTTETTDKTILRILVPGENKSLVPRDIVNVTMCNKLNDSASTGVVSYFDSTMGTYTCTYEGIGDNENGKYDIGSDLIVDRFEAGCSYTKSPDPLYSCSNDSNQVANDGSCIGTVDPTADVAGNPVYVATAGAQIYYNRTTGTCYRLTSSTNIWTEIDSLPNFTNIVDKHTYSQLPPIVNISQDKANSFCNATSSDPILGLCPADERGAGDPATIVPIAVAGRVYLDTNSTMCYTYNGAAWVNYRSGPTSKLPTRKEQIAYSEWDYSLISTSTVNNREQGLSLNSTSKCNSTFASGLESFYTDSVSPIFSSIFTLPGTLSSNIRSVMTGSEKTNLCTSKFGLQDTIGNVSEWSSDRMYCSNFSCTGTVSSQSRTAGACDINLDGSRNENCEAAGSPQSVVYAARGVVYLDTGSAELYINLDGVNTWKIYKGSLTQTSTCDINGDSANGEACAGNPVFSGDPTGYFLGSAGAIFEDTASGDLYLNLLADTDWIPYNPNRTQTSTCDIDSVGGNNDLCASPGLPDGYVPGELGAIYTDTPSSTTFVNVDGASAWIITGNTQTSNCDIAGDLTPDEACTASGTPNGLSLLASQFAVYTDSDDGKTYLNVNGVTAWVPYGPALAQTSECDTNNDGSRTNACSGAVSMSGSPDGEISGDVNSIYIDSTTLIQYINTDGAQDWRVYQGGLTRTTNCNLYLDALADDACETPADLNGWMSANVDSVFTAISGEIFINIDGDNRWSLYSGGSATLNNDNDFVPFAATSVEKFKNYGFNGFSGPCIDLNSDDVCDGNLTSWILDQKSNGANRFSIPMGMPMTNNFVANNPGEMINNFFEQIGISSGITSTQLQDDVVIINQLENSIAGGNTSGIAGLVSGGSYKTEQGSGTHFLELVPKDNPTADDKRPDIGFRCVSPVYPSHFVD